MGRGTSREQAGRGRTVIGRVVVFAWLLIPYGTCGAQCMEWGIAGHRGPCRPRSLNRSSEEAQRKVHSA